METQQMKNIRIIQYTHKYNFCLARACSHFAGKSACSVLPGIHRCYYFLWPWRYYLSMSPSSIVRDEIFMSRMMIIQCKNQQQGMKQKLGQDPSLRGITPYRHGQIRFLALALLVIVQVANQYTFNNPQALQDSIQEKLHIEQSKFNMLYTIIAFPNIFFGVFIGVVIDYFGIRMTFLLMVLGLPLFQLIVAFGGVYSSFNTMLAGRFLFGLVNQSIIIAQACYVSYWFMGKELAMALGLAVTLPQLGNALNSYVTPIIYEKTQSLGPPLFTSVGVCFIAFLCACVMTYLDRKADQVDERNNIKIITDLEQADAEVPQTIKCEDLKMLKHTFWLIAALCMFSMAQYVPFLDNANALLQVRFCFSQVTAGKNITITYIVVGAFGLPIGLLVDKIGFKRYFIILGMCVFTIGHSIILLYPQCTESDVFTEWSGASWGLFLIGIGYCFYANCLIPSIPLVVSKRITGTAFGVMGMLEDAAEAFYPWISGRIVQNAKDPQSGYLHSSLFYVVTGLLGISISILLLFINQKDKLKLDSSSDEKIIKKVKLHAYQSDVERKSKKWQSQTKKVPYFSDNTQNDNAASQSDLEAKRKSLKIQMQLFKSRLAKSNNDDKAKRESKSQKKLQNKKKQEKLAKKHKQIEREFNDFNYASGQDDEIKQEPTHRNKKKGDMKTETAQNNYTDFLL